MSCSEEDKFQGPPQGVLALREEGPGLEYVKQFKEHKALVSSFASQVTADRGQEQTVPEAKWAWLKVYKQKWNEPRWTGPFKVVTGTSHAVQLRGKGETWYQRSLGGPKGSVRRRTRLRPPKQRSFDIGAE